MNFRVVSARSWLRDAVTLLLAVASVATAGWLYVQHGSEHLRRLASTDMALHVDFDTFWRSAAALWAGTDLYRTGASYPNLNPPFATVIFAPLGLLDIVPSYHLWVLCTVALVLGSMIAVAAELRVPAAWAMPVGFVALVSAPMVGTLALGQIYGVLTALITVCWLADRRGRPILAGVGLGIAIAIKPLLLLLVLLPLLRRQRLLLGAALVTTAVASAIGVAVAGWASVSGWLRELFGTGADPYIGNASLPGTIVRLFSSNVDAAPVVPLPGALFLGYLLAAVVLALTLDRLRPGAAARPGPDEPDTGLWALTAAALLASPIAWQNYLVLLAPAMLVVLAAGRRAQLLLLLAPPLIGMEWVALWPSNNPGASLPLSLYAAILLVYWLVLLPARGPALPRLVDPVAGVPSRTEQQLAAAMTGSG